MVTFVLRDRKDFLKIHYEKNIAVGIIVWYHYLHMITIQPCTGTKVFPDAEWRM